MCYSRTYKGHIHVSYSQVKHLLLVYLDVNFTFLFPMIYCLEFVKCFMHHRGHSAETYSVLNTQAHLFLFLFVKY